MLVGGSLSQNGTQLGHRVEIPGCPSSLVLSSLTNAWSQLARVLKLNRHMGLRGTEHGREG